MTNKAFLGSKLNLAQTISNMTRSKISISLLGKTDSLETRLKKSSSKVGPKNPFYGRGPGIKALDLATESTGIKVYVYDVATFSLVNNQPFKSIRAATKDMPISPNSLACKIDDNKPFKGYYYFSSPQITKPSK